MSLGGQRRSLQAQAAALVFPSSSQPMRYVHSYAALAFDTRLQAHGHELHMLSVHHRALVAHYNAGMHRCTPMAPLPSTSDGLHDGIGVAGSMERAAAAGACTRGVCCIAPPRELLARKGAGGGGAASGAVVWRYQYLRVQKCPL